MAAEIHIGILVFGLLLLIIVLAAALLLLCPLSGAVGEVPARLGQVLDVRELKMLVPVRSLLKLGCVIS